VFALAVGLSLAGLAAGAGVVALGRGTAATAKVLDGFTLGLIPALVLLRLVPHVVEELGGAGVGLLALGFGMVWLAQRRSHDVGAKVGRSIVVPALIVHSFTDGAGLGLAAHASEAGRASGGMLAVAIVMHRLPEGLFIVASLLPEIGWRGALLRLGAVAAATVVGAGVGHELSTLVPHALLDGVVAVGFGAMLRLVAHTHGPPATSFAHRAASGVGFLGGLGLAFVVPDPEGVLAKAQPGELAILDSLGPLLVQTAPALLVGLLVTGAIHAFALPRSPSSLGRGSGLVQALRGVSFALGRGPSGAVWSELRRLSAARVPAPALAAFVIGAMHLDVPALALGLRLLGGPFTLARLAFGLLLAVMTALLVARAAASGSDGAAPAPATAGAEGGAPRTTRLRSLFGEAFGPALDRAAGLYVLGLLSAAAIEAFLDPALVRGVGAPLDVFVMALVAVPASISPVAGAAVAAVMIHKGMSVGAAGAFLLVGAAASPPILGLFRRRFGGRAALALAAGGAGLAALFGLAAQRLLPASSVPGVHELVELPRGPLAWAAAGLVAALVVASLVRRGPRSFFAEVMPLAEEGADHGHEGHDHHDHHRLPGAVSARGTAGGDGVQPPGSSPDGTA
jgi:uncharacterized protein